MCIRDSAQSFSDMYNVLGYPTHVVINKAGNVEAVFQGVNQRIDELLSRAIESALNRKPNDRPFSRQVSAPTEDEVMINPNSVIVDEHGIIVPFSKFTKLMREGHFELFNSKDLVGNKVIMMKEISRN